MHCCYGEGEPVARPNDRQAAMPLPTPPSPNNDPGFARRDAEAEGGMLGDFWLSGCLDDDDDDNGWGNSTIDD